MTDGRWRVKANVICRVKPDETEVSPPGVWMVLCHGPNAGSSWWLMPSDIESRTWASTSTEVSSGCVQVTGRRLTPARVYSDGGWR